MTILMERQVARKSHWRYQKPTQLRSEEKMYKDACEKLKALYKSLESKGFMVEIDKSIDLEQSLEWFDKQELTTNSLVVFFEDQEFYSQFCSFRKGIPTRNVRLSYEDVLSLNFN